MRISSPGRSTGQFLVKVGAYMQFKPKRGAHVQSPVPLAFNFLARTV